MMTDYEKYLDNQALKAEVKNRLKVDDIVYVQQDQFIHKAQVVKISEKSTKLKMFEGSFKDEMKNFPYIKIAKEGDSVVVVWEAWRGMQGKGGYRWEREAYEKLRVPVETIPHRAVVCEEAFLRVNTVYEKSYLDKLNNHNKNKKVSLK